MSVDPYKTLGVEKDAGPDDVKRAYRKRAKKTHPDVGGKSEEFEKVQRSYMILSDPARRKRFDETGQDEERPIDDPMVPVLALVSKMIMEFMTAGEALIGVNAIELMQDSLDKNLVEIANHITKTNAEIGKLEKMQKKFKRKGKGENMIAKILDGYMGPLKMQVLDAEKAMIDHRRTKEFLRDYDFTPDKPPPQVIRPTMADFAQFVQPRSPGAASFWNT